jgi:hypothetical protein
MIEPLYWNGTAGRIHGRGPDDLSPFDPRSSRPLLVTLDAASFSNLAQAQCEALTAFRELSNLDLVDATDSSADAATRLVFGSPTWEGHIPVTLVNGGADALYGLVRNYDRRLDVAVNDPAHPARSLLVAGAHQALGRDLLVTESPAVFDRRDYGITKYGNPRRILDAIRVVGLFLRSRGCYAYWAEKPGFTQSFDRGLFYWVLTRHHTPSMWRYHSACYAAAKNRNDDTGSLSSAVLQRCDRAFQSRDRIAQAFYRGSRADVRDELMYHFDYLTLLLMGAIDAQARVAHRVYGLPGDERRAAFQHVDWRSALEKVAPALVGVVTADRARGVLGMLRSLRNTIHGVPLPGFTVHGGEHPATIEVEQHAEAAQLRNACEALGSLSDWGFSTETYVDAESSERREHLRLEPYTLADALVWECVRLVDAIAAGTEVARLFAPGAVPDLLSEPPEDGIFSAGVRARIALLV